MGKIHVYGIPNCDITKKALRWLEDHGLDPVFHDHKKEGPGRVKLNDWCERVGWERLLNRRSTTWRNLSVAQQAEITNKAAAIRTMTENNSIIKRPVIEFGKNIFIGFDETELSKYFLNR
jgi:arsenate reductase